MKLWSNDAVTRGDVEDRPGSAPSPLIPPDIHSILYFASLAPSGHNTQPWNVRLGHDEMWIGTERARWLPKVDPTNREVALSLGAFLENLILAAPAHGYIAECETVGPVTATGHIHVRLVQGPRQNVHLEAIRSRRTVSLRMPVSWFLKT